MRKIRIRPELQEREFFHERLPHNWEFANQLKRRVTIKILSPSLAADHDRPARFQREAEVLASLNHPNIAAIHGLEDSGDITALVMELVEGDDLSQRIARGAMLRACDKTTGREVGVSICWRRSSALR